MKEADCLKQNDRQGLSATLFEGCLIILNSILFLTNILFFKLYDNRTHEKEVALRINWRVICSADLRYD